MSIIKFQSSSENKDFRKFDRISMLREYYDEISGENNRSEWYGVMTHINIHEELHTLVNQYSSFLKAAHDIETKETNGF